MLKTIPVIFCFLQMTFLLHFAAGQSLYSFDNELSNFNKSVLFGAPFVDHMEDDITLSVSSNFTISCKSREPVSWKIPDILDPTTNYFVKRDSDDAELPYLAQLHLNNVDHTFVGFYYCVRDPGGDNVEQLLENFQATAFYIFVEDPNNLIVDADVVVNVQQFEAGIIPCKPTSKSVTVEMLKDDEESDPLRLPYDPTKGFELFAEHLTDGGIYYCRPVNNSQAVKMFQLIVNPRTQTTYINKPKISSSNGLHATQGESLTLNCSVEINLGVYFTISWTTPNNRSFDEGRATVGKTYTESHPTNSHMIIGISQLTIRNMDRQIDAGRYFCTAADHNSRNNTDNVIITVLDRDQGFINITEPSGKYSITRNAKTSVQWILNYRGYPTPIYFTFYDNTNKEIQENSKDEENQKYTIKIHDHHIQFKIKHIELKDTGTYTIVATNNLLEQERKLELVVTDQPSVHLDSVYIMEHEMARVKCQAAGYPPATFNWSFIPCSIRPKWPTCHPSDIVNFEGKSFITSQTSDLAQTSELAFSPSSPGLLTCSAQNEHGHHQMTVELKIGDIKNSIDVWGVDSKHPISINDEVNLTCGALVYNFSGPLHWYRNNILVESDPDAGIEVTESTTDFSYRKLLKFKNIQKTDAGIYSCIGNTLDQDNSETKDIDVVVHDPLSPHLENTNLNDDSYEKYLGEYMNLICEFSGIPKPTIQWFKDDIQIVDEGKDNPNATINIHDDNTVLHFKYIKPEDEGTYKCVGSNKMGDVTKSTTLRIVDLPKIGTVWYIAIGVGIFCMLLLCILMYIRNKRMQKRLKELREAGLANFEEGSPECINPALSLDEQADLLPYNKNFEFPRENLKMGKQLGAGAFGIVVKGLAKGILPYEDETTVAVKMVKKNADNEVMRALISELKIMVHLGQHINVVNLLGAVTKNIVKREVMVIVEYCRYGNVQNFLLKHREQFIDQINPETDMIDPSILTMEQRWSNDSGYEYNSQGLKYLKMSFPKTNNDIIRKNESHQPRISSRGYVRNSALNRPESSVYTGALDSCNTEATLISEYGDDQMILSNNSVQPGWRSNYRMDYKGPARTVTTSDLVCWGFQVARGMEYLASRNILHGDLAARNILLCDDNVVKICDFGLARTMYKSNNYKKQGEAPLPFKWLALESISDQVFSTYSDIWSFGIVLWEFFSLAKVPYPGMDADQKLYMKLKDGYRMDKPEYANQEIYEIMLECWRANPETRPMFAELEKNLGQMLQDGVKDHYIDLNEPYLQMNNEYFKTSQKDYLACSGPPEEMAPPVPNYVNANVMKDSPTDNSYLKMSPKSGNVYYDNSTKGQNADQSPSEPPKQITLSDAMFKKSPPATNSEKNSKAGNRNRIPEEIPMLKPLNEAMSSDSENELSPDVVKNSPKFTDNANYVNVPSSTVIDMSELYNPKDAFSNPTYVGLKKTADTKS